METFLDKLRSKMAEENINAWWVTGTDPHMSEYLPNYWKEREFISGFSGSAGELIITQSDAVLWTDSRYFLQAEQEISANGFRLFKKGIEGTPSLFDYLSEKLNKGDQIGVNGLCLDYNTGVSLNTFCQEKEFKLHTDLNLINTIWEDRPKFPNNNLKLVPDNVAGVSSASKIELIRQELASYHADYFISSSLDEIAWLFNLRGSDIEFNPVFYAYAIIGKEYTLLFVDDKTIAPNYLSHNVTVKGYNEVFEHIKTFEPDKVFIFDNHKTSYSLGKLLEQTYKTKIAPSLIALPKACKNATELSGFKTAMIEDGVALVKFYMWLERLVSEGKYPSEYEAGLQLATFRSESKYYVSESFSPIVGYKENGAIVHYSAKKEQPTFIKAEGILLIDSGAQYTCGTTDITRTISLGKGTPESKKHYTWVLRGHLALVRSVFPQGTRGVQLDSYARHYLWQQGLDYGHGTGHGVGHFLNVHEGPQTIRKEDNGVPLKEGMVVSNEPGFYLEGEYGIRIENLIAVCPAKTKHSNDFLGFETLTLFPYDLDLIDRTQLSRLEVEQINAYHQFVYEMISPNLGVSEKEWLRIKTRQA